VGQPGCCDSCTANRHRDWWQKRRQAFDLYVSPEVLKEAGRGDANAARERLERLAECRVLAVTDLAESLAEKILAAGLIPAPASSDVVHIGYAAAHGMDFLLTWNCRHILNATIERRLDEGLRRIRCILAGALHAF
jgi:hypothetical protein